MFDKLKDGSTVAILLQRIPDPDAIGCAAGLSWFLQEKYGAESSFFHIAPISHAQTRAMVNVLGINLQRVDEVPESDFYVAMDSPLLNTGFECNIDVIIDHHKGPYEVEKEFLIHADVGACATLVWELIRDELEGKFPENPTVATALFMGIYSDTDGLRGPGATERDFQAFQDLFGKVDRGRLKEIFNYPIPAYQFDLEAEAIKARVVEDSKLVTYLGDISPGQRDVMPEVADDMLRMQGVNAVVVFAFVGDHVDASVRSTDPTLDVDKLCKDCFGAEFHGTAGSKQGGIGGGRAPLGIAITDEDEEQDRAEALDGLAKRLQKRVLKRLKQ